MKNNMNIILKDNFDIFPCAINVFQLMYLLTLIAVVYVSCFITNKIIYPLFDLKGQLKNDQLLYLSVLVFIFFNLCSVTLISSGILSIENGCNITIGFITSILVSIFFVTYKNN